MKNKTVIRTVLFFCAALLAAGTMLLPPRAVARDDVANAIRRYKNREMSTGFYKKYEVKPGRRSNFIKIPGVAMGVSRFNPATAKVRSSSRLSDSHQGIKNYVHRQCAECHVEQTRDLHTVRANLTCRQCHGDEPIAGIDHYYSLMNPIRRHAYVCAKCHEGSNASFASYVVHEPNPAHASTFRNFPVLSIAFWVMIAIAVGTFALFLPHTLIWGIRELFMKKEKKNSESSS